MLWFDNELTLLSYKFKTQKYLFLGSMCDEEGVVTENMKKITMDELHQLEGGIDNLDQMCALACSKKLAASHSAIFMTFSALHSLEPCDLCK